MQKIGELRPCGWLVSQLCEQTDRQTYSSQYFAPVSGAKQTKVYRYMLGEQVLQGWRYEHRHVCVSVCLCVSSQASLSTRRSSHVPSDTASRPATHGRDSMSAGRISYQHLHHHQQQQQQQQGSERRKSPLSDSTVPGASEALFSAIPPSLAAAFELPGIHISRIETLDFEDDAISRCVYCPDRPPTILLPLPHRLHVPRRHITPEFIGPISWGHSGPLCHALSLSLSSLLSLALSWTSMRRRRATVPLATSSEWA